MPDHVIEEYDTLIRQLQEARELRGRDVHHRVRIACKANDQVKGVVLQEGFRRLIQQDVNRLQEAGYDGQEIVADGGCMFLPDRVTILKMNTFQLQRR